MDVHGFLRDDKGVVVAEFRSAHGGMGKFTFIPESQRSYTAFIQLDKGKEISYPFMQRRGGT